MTSIICLGLVGALAFAPAAQAGIAGLEFLCNESGDTHISDTFCDDGILYEVEVNCLNLEDGIGGGLQVYPPGLGEGSGFWDFYVVQGTADVLDYVCEASGVYGDSLKTELKCTDADKGPNKPDHPKWGDGFDQADFEIKSLGPDDSCNIF
jgi:hypothetical protein